MTETPEKQDQQQDQAEKQDQETDKQSPTAPPPDDLSKDPAYEPEDEDLKGIKGG